MAVARASVGVGVLVRLARRDSTTKPYGVTTALEKARFCRMTKRSPTQCAVILDVCRTLGLTDVQCLRAGRELLPRIVSMLVQMVRRSGGSGTGTR